MTSILWRQFKGHSGCLVRGTVPISAPCAPKVHLSCAAYLTAQVEAPYFGTVQSFDGAGISAGFLHDILVFPADLSQGSLGIVVYKVALAAMNAGGVLINELKARGWTLGQDGKFRDAGGALVSGAALRNWVAPPDGKVPQSGPQWDQAARLALAFHNLFSDPAGFAVQEQCAIKWLVSGNRTAETAVYQHYMNQPNLPSADGVEVSAMPPEIHLAMSVYHSFSVNSPKVAADCLARCPLTLSPSDFAKALIRELGTHGRDVWHDQPGDGDNRYDRTRAAAWGRSDLFPGAADLMPRDLA
jgi:hypothetical protein